MINLAALDCAYCSQKTRTRSLLSSSLARACLYYSKCQRSNDNKRDLGARRKLAKCCAFREREYYAIPLGGALDGFLSLFHLIFIQKARRATERKLHWDNTHSNTGRTQFHLVSKISSIVMDALVERVEVLSDASVREGGGGDGSGEERAKVA